MRWTPKTGQSFSCITRFDKPQRQGFKVIRERRSAAFKKKVALEAIREKKTINEIASAFDVHPVQVGKWKKQLLEGLDDIFESSSRKKKDSNNLAAIDGSLHEKIGRLTMELDWLKKKLEHV
jgi:transposase-like protein